MTLNDNSIAVDDPMQENIFLEDLDGVFGGDSTEEGVADELLQADSGTRQPQDEGVTSGNHNNNNPLSLSAAPTPLHSRSDGENSDGSQQEIVSSSCSAKDSNKNNDSGSGSAAASATANATGSATSATKAKNAKDIGENERKRELRQRRSSLDTKGAEKGLPPPSWHSEAADKHHRQEMIMEIARLLSARKKNQPTKEWVRQLPHKARRLEDKLYRTASSLEAYLNRTTLKRRLRNIARIISSQHHRLSKLNCRSSMSSKRPSVLSNTSSISSISSLGSLDSFVSAASDASKSTSTEQRRVSFLPLTGLNLDSVEPIQTAMIPNNNAQAKQQNSSSKHGTSQQQWQSSVTNESLQNFLMQQLVEGNNNNSDSLASRSASSSERNNALSNNSVPIVNNNINNNNTSAPPLPVNSSMLMPGQLLVQHDSVSELEQQKAVNAKLQEQIIKDLRQQEARVQELLQGRGNKSQQKGGQAVSTVQPISNNVPNSRTSAAVSVIPTTTMTPLYVSNNHAALHSQPATPAVSAATNNMQGNNIIANTLERQQINQNAIAVAMQQQQGNQNAMTTAFQQQGKRNALAMTVQQQGNQQQTVQQNLHALQLAQFGGAQRQHMHLAAMLLGGGINAGMAAVAAGQVNVGGVAAAAGQLNVGAAAGVVPNPALANQLAAGSRLQQNASLFSSPGLPLHQQLMFSGHTGGATTAVGHRQQQQNALQQQQNNASATTGRVGAQPTPIVPDVASGPSISSGFDPTMPPPKNKLLDETATDSFDDSEILSSASFAW